MRLRTKIFIIAGKILSLLVKPIGDKKSLRNNPALWGAAVLAACLAIRPAAAQQPQQPQLQSPSAVAIQMDNVINQWAQTIEAQQQNLKAAQEQISALQKENAELKAALPKKPEAKP